MPTTTRTPPRRKRPDRYHHGDLRRALVQEALRVIQSSGVEALTLRTAGARLGVSRTALYRHFTSKDDLLGAVAGEGFRTLRAALDAAWRETGGGRAGLAAMGRAYVRFAEAHPAHYRVMFGGFVRPDTVPCDDGQRDGDAFAVLVEAITALQQQGLVRDDEPRLLARYIWSVVHGIAMLALDGIVAPRGEVDGLTGFALERIGTGIARLPSP